MFDRGQKTNPSQTSLRRPPFVLHVDTGTASGKAAGQPEIATVALKSHLWPGDLAMTIAAFFNSVPGPSVVARDDAA